MKALLFLRVVAILLPVPAAAETNSFLEAHCFDCHDSETQKGKLDLTTLKLDEANFEKAACGEFSGDALAVSEAHLGGNERLSGPVCKAAVAVA